VTVQMRSLDPQSAELMFINLSSSSNPLFPGTDPPPPTPPPIICISGRTPGSSKVSQFQGKKKKIKPANSNWICLAMGFSMATWVARVAGARGVGPLLPAQFAQDTKDPKAASLGNHRVRPQASRTESAGSVASIGVT